MINSSHQIGDAGVFGLFAGARTSGQLGQWMDARAERAGTAYAAAQAEEPSFSLTFGDPAVANWNEFNITINFLGAEWEDPDNADLLQAFVDSAEYLVSVITEDIEFAFAGFNFVDDIEIDARITEIDGEGGVLGQAGPTAVRVTGDEIYLPAKAIMEFDVADASTFSDAGLFDDIVLHEMLHTLGFGTTWFAAGLLQITRDTQGTWRWSDDTFDFRFLGENAQAAYAEDFPEILAADTGTGIPVEDQGGLGTAGGHWDEETFGGELMTGYIDLNNLLSYMTVAALADMGYTVVDRGDWTPPDFIA